MGRRPDEPGRVEELAASGPDRRWRPSARPVIIGVLLLEALLAAAWAIWPPAETNRTLDAAMAALLLVAAGVLAVAWRQRGPLVLVQIGLVLTWIVPLLVIVSRRLEVSQVLWGAVIIMIAAVSAFYLPRRQAIAHVAVLAAAFVIAALVTEPSTRPLIVGAVLLCMVVAAGAVARMRKERDRMVDRIASLAVADPLTGLLNRRGLEAQAGVVHANALRSGQETVVAVIDLDGLKKVNDTQGHEAGDALINGVAEHWRANLREGDLLARVGGDEFVIVLPHASPDSAAELLTRIRMCAAAEWSHGWTVWNEGESLDAAVERADALMYADKAERRSGRG